MRSTVNKRVLKDVADAIKNLKEEYGIYIAVEENNYYNVHFIMPGPPDTVYEFGLYHGMIRLNPNHPLNAPNVHMITPSGRFEVESHPIPSSSRGICFTYTAFHPECWAPVLTIESVVIGFISFMCDDKDPGQMSIQTPINKRKQLATQSHKNLLAEPIVEELFPELYAMLKKGTYVPFKHNDPGKIKTIESKKPISKKSNEVIEISSEEEEIKPKKKLNKKAQSSESEEELRPKKKLNKKVQSSSEEEPKPKRKVNKKVESSSEEEVKPKKKVNKKIESSSEEEPVKSKKKPVEKSKKKPTKKMASSSESEELIPISKPKKKVSKKVESSESEEELISIPKSKKKSSKK